MTSDPMERFEEELRHWAQKPSKMSADEASQAVAGRLQDLPRSGSLPYPFRSWLRVAAVVAAAAMLLLWLRPPNFWFHRQPLESPSSAFAVPPSQENVALIWLDTETPLYLTLPEVKQEKETTQ